MLDALGDRLMYRLARFDDSTNQHFLVTHSVNNTTAVAARWYEFQAPSGTTSLSLHQSGETPDDGEYRWMGSVASDKVGDIALGYSRSSAAAGDYPSIYYAGQTAGDAPGTTETEALVLQGGGSQFSTSNRWGDYSSMALDGTDFCTFWYTQEYDPVDGSFAWATAGFAEVPELPVAACGSPVRGAVRACGLRGLQSSQARTRGPISGQKGATAGSSMKDIVPQATPKPVVSMELL